MSNGGNRRPPFINRNQNFDSNGPDVRIRGSAYQVHEKYLNLASDATAAGDRIGAESYYQHAEHYYRIINAQEYGPEDGRRQRQESHNGQNQGNGYGEEPQPDFGQGDPKGGEQPEMRDAPQFLRNGEGSNRNDRRDDRDQGNERGERSGGDERNNRGGREERNGRDTREESRSRDARQESSGHGAPEDREDRETQESQDTQGSGDMGDNEEDEFDRNEQPE